MSTATTAPAIRFVEVTRRFGAVSAVNSVSLDVSAGSFVALVGPSGSGKSTLLKMINRLEDPDSGSIDLNGLPVTAEPPPQLRRKIGYVFQNIGLFPHLSVGENIRMGLKVAGETLSAERLQEMLQLVDLAPDIALRMPDALSGGQRQRVGVARALAPAPQILLMDEPFGALDPVTRDALGREVRAIHDRLGLTTIMVTHDMAEALLLADRVLVMEQGAIVGDASPADLLAGKGGAVADALVAIPRDQARRLAELGS